MLRTYLCTEHIYLPRGLFKNVGASEAEKIYCIFLEQQQQPVVYREIKVYESIARVLCMYGTFVLTRLEIVS